MKCPSCAFENRPDVRFCENCGNPLAVSVTETQQAGGRSCPNCGAMNPLDTRYCDQCGNPLFVQAAPAGILCPSCGMKNPAGNRFCENCGNNLFVFPSPASLRQRSSTFGRLALITMSLIIVGVAVTVLVNRLGPSSSSSPQSPSLLEVIAPGEVSTESPQIAPEGNTEEAPRSESTENVPAQSDPVQAANTNEPLTMDQPNSSDSSPTKTPHPQRDTVEANPGQSGSSFYGFTNNQNPSSRECIPIHRPENTRCISSIIVFVHGAAAAPEPFYDQSVGMWKVTLYEEWINHFMFSGRYPELSNVMFLPFRWGDESGDSPIYKASDSIGHRSYQYYGMMEIAWFGVWKLQQLVASTQAAFPGVPIVIVSHSMGTEITLAALQEGMKIDYWILMGSPLDQDYVSGCYDLGLGLHDPNVHLALAARNVSGWVWNLFSPPGPSYEGDWVTAMTGGIGSFGIAQNCVDWQGGQLGYGENVYNTSIPDISHSTNEGHGGWWNAAHLAGQMDAQTLSALTYALGGGNAPMQAFDNDYINAVFLKPPPDPDASIANPLEFGLYQWALLKPSYMRATREDGYWGTPFRKKWIDPGGDERGFYAYLYLPPGMSSGWYSDDKDYVRYQVSCHKGSAVVRLDQAIWEDSKKVQEDVVLQGIENTRSYYWEVDSSVYDATLLVQVSNWNPGISECELWFYSKDR